MKATQSEGGDPALVDPGSRDPATLWPESIPIAYGTANHGWLIQEVSADVKAVTDRDPADWLGRSLLDLVHPDDVALVTGLDGAPRLTAVSLFHVRSVHRVDGWVPAALLLIQLGIGQRYGFAFAIIGMSRSLPSSTSDRVVELEWCLRRIGSEIRAVGLIDGVDEPPTVSDDPRLGDLTTRQWEILSLLLQGERVSTISAALFISQSTARNHLATIFRKFGVHSQQALLQLLRPNPWPTSQPSGDNGFVRRLARTHGQVDLGQPTPSEPGELE